jgi:hypothetical protein
MLWAEGSENRIEQMLERGRKITLDALNEYKPVAVFGGFSGGDDLFDVFVGHVIPLCLKANKH